MLFYALTRSKLKKEIIDAWVEEWRRTTHSKQSERAVIADIIFLLSELSEDGLRRIQDEVSMALVERR